MSEVACFFSPHEQEGGHNSSPERVTLTLVHYCTMLIAKLYCGNCEILQHKVKCEKITTPYAYSTNYSRLYNYFMA